MKQKKINLLVFAGIMLSYILFNGCNFLSNHKKINSDELKELVQKWNNAHLSKDVGVFSNLYDNSILYYGIQMDKNSCIESKITLLKKYPDFYQQIYGDILIDNINRDEIKCSFVKRVTINMKTSDYPSYLTFKKSGDGWKIVTEGDLVTDKNRANKENPSFIEGNKQDYFYEPSVSIILGTIKIESFFGPPGYGENPQTDSREDSYILNLDSPINVISNEKEIEEGDFNYTKYNITKIQLTSTSNVNLTNFKNRIVRLTGTFFGASTGHHHTEVLMDVSKIEAE